MAFQLSPGVNVSEVDLTTVVPSVLTTAGAIAGQFQWGPVNKRISVDSEITLVNRFGKPNGNTYTSFFTASGFLSYGNNLKVVRAANTASLNASETGSISVPNEDVFEVTYLHQNNANTYGSFIARYQGGLGNTLSVSVADSASYDAWEFKGYFSTAPGTSAQAAAAGATNDELHIIVIDEGGIITGTQGSILEQFAYVSKGSNALDSLGNSNYYKNVLFNQSKYVYAIDPPDYSNTNATWGNALAGTSYATLATAYQGYLVNGSDEEVQDGDITNAYGLFVNSDEVDIALVMSGNASVPVQQYIIDNIVTVRKDCVATISPPSASVVNNAGNEVTDITAWTASLARSTSYAIADSGWKYVFDKYNNTYRWVPLNGDIAGLCVYTDYVRDAWFSPAGINRGNIKNAVKLAWNPVQADRDAIYSLGVNPVITLAGSGTVLFGDKTLQTKPSNFDRINVRRLFIVLEKTIARAARSSMFEFNDDFTRSQFVSLITPFLRDVQGRRGIYDFRVVCDATNNTSQVIDSNQFVGDIYIKPARSINYIQLNFVSVRTGVDFTEVVGKF
jgi:Phage tail sheath protein subtilisin-like domain/Phage tail sheath C-terminal domain